MYEHNALGYWSGLALCLTKVRSSRARCPATALIPIQMHWRPKLTLPLIGQGHPRVMIYINYDGPAPPMLHTVKLRGNRPTGSGEEDFLKVFAIYSHGGHLGHVTWTILYKLSFPLPEDAPHEVWL